MKFYQRASVLCLLVLQCMMTSSKAATLPKLSVPMLAKEPTMSGRVDATWAGAVKGSTAFDFTNRRAASQPATVFVAQDATGIDVAFIVPQKQTVDAATLTNGPAVQNDDNVGVFISPQGTQGFSYDFYANARGARTQTSSENTAYTPTWVAAGRVVAPGYCVTMHIPFAILRTGGSTKWRVQFARFQVASNSVDLWSYSSLATSPSDPTFFGTLTGVAADLKGSDTTKRPAPRFQPYALGVGRSSFSGGSTSQVGLDMAVPITPTASFVGSFHPDYSNVETDQQTISPTAFPRQYQEVRPFFTQVGNEFDNYFGCMSCPLTIYTPAIPTFRQGYGVEGAQGPISFSGFDTSGSGRTDIANAIDLSKSSTANSYSLTLQRVSVDTPGFVDDVSAVTSGYFDQRSHILVYGNYGRDSGTFVTDPAQANYSEIGAGYKTANTVFIAAHQFVGAQYNPVDGFVQQNDIGGYESYAQHTFTFPARSRLQDVAVDFNVSKFWNHLAQPAQSNAGYQVNVDLKDRFALHVFQQSSFVLTSAGEYLPFSDGNGAAILYNSASNYPVGLVYNAGAYYHGRAESWQLFDTAPVTRKVSLSINLSENSYAAQRIVEPSFRQWLNSGSVNWQISRDASFSLGARRINGVSLQNSFATPDYTPLFANNLSAAFHYLHGHNEFYLVYGDPNSLVTTPAIFFKWIFYAGAEKGT